jgi:ribosomal protein L37AE/L43A
MVYECPYCDSTDIQCANETEGIWICNSCDKWFYSDALIVEDGDEL